jgi:hypothetical protein
MGIKGKRKEENECPDLSHVSHDMAPPSTSVATAWLKLAESAELSHFEPS